MGICCWFSCACKLQYFIPYFIDWHACADYRTVVAFTRFIVPENYYFIPPIYKCEVRDLLNIVVDIRFVLLLIYCKPRSYAQCRVIVSDCFLHGSYTCIAIKFIFVCQAACCVSSGVVHNHMYRLYRFRQELDNAIYFIFINICVSNPNKGLSSESLLYLHTMSGKITHYVNTCRCMLLLSALLYWIGVTFQYCLFPCQEFLHFRDQFSNLFTVIFNGLIILCKPGSNVAHSILCIMFEFP